MQNIRFYKNRISRIILIKERIDFEIPLRKKKLN